MEPTPTPAGQEQRAAELSVLEAAVKRFNEAFNRLDAKEVASFWAEHGSLITPAGIYGEGLAGVETAFREDAQTILDGTTSRFMITRVRRVGDCAFLDLDHKLQNCKTADGSRTTLTLHVAILAQKQGEDWRWLDVRPYRFIDRPPSIH